MSFRVANYERYVPRCAQEGVWAVSDTTKRLPEKVEKIVFDHHLLHGGVGFLSANCGTCQQERVILREALDAEREQGRREARNPSVDEALNIGDGVYRP